MSKMFTGSICLTDLIENAKKKHSCFSKSQANGKIYANVILWENDETDKFGNTHSLQLNSSKENKESEGKIYIGNMKPVEKKEPQPLSDKDVKSFIPDNSGLPF